VSPPYFSPCIPLARRGRESSSFRASLCTAPLARLADSCLLKRFATKCRRTRAVVVVAVVGVADALACSCRHWCSRCHKEEGTPTTRQGDGHG
jgi:hypothetical protein